MSKKIIISAATCRIQHGFDALLVQIKGGFTFLTPDEARSMANKFIDAADRAEKLKQKLNKVMV